MVGLVISDSFLLCGVWHTQNGSPYLKSLVRVPFTESLTSILYNEADLNTVLSSSLRKATETHPFDGQSVIVGFPDEFVTHGVIEAEPDLSREDYQDYMQWLEERKGKPEGNNVSLFGQVYLPDEPNIHYCAVSQALILTLKLSIPELGGFPHWMGPVSSLYLDGSGMSEAAMIQRFGNRYTFYKVQNNRFDMGMVAFSGGTPKVISTTDSNEDITLAALGIIESDLDDIPVFCPQKLGRQATAAWENSDFRISIPFEGVDIGDQNIDGLPEYEANILTQLINNISSNYSFNFFEEPGITDFFFTEVIQTATVADSEEPEPVILPPDDDEKPVQDQPKQPSSWGYVFSSLLIVGLFIGFNYIKLQDELNHSIFGLNKGFSIDRSGISERTVTETLTKGKVHQKLLKQSKAISSVLLNLLTQTDLDRYNSLTITKSFVSLEYTSGVNPNIENILAIDPTSFSVDAEGEDSTVFLWYYSFDLPEQKSISPAGTITKKDLMVQLDTSLVDYSLRYFEQIYTENQIYGPLLIWVRNKADILETSAILSNVGDDILLRKFTLINEPGRATPRAGFYVSILED